MSRIRIVCEDPSSATPFADFDSSKIGNAKSYNGKTDPTKSFIRFDVKSAKGRMAANAEFVALHNQNVSLGVLQTKEKEAMSVCKAGAEAYISEDIAIKREGRLMLG